MIDDRPVDLSALDPSQDVRRWERQIQRVVERAIVARLSPATVAAQLAAWLRPALAGAAAVSLGVLSVGLLQRGITDDGSRLSTRSAVGNEEAEAVDVGTRQGSAELALQRWAFGDGGSSVWSELQQLEVGNDE